MFLAKSSAAAVLICFACSGCAELAPSLPPDTTYPVRDIVARTTCDLYHAFSAVSGPGYKRFKAKNWLIAITLTPRVDTDFQPGLGAKRFVPANVSAERLTTWIFGGAPGVYVDFKGERTGGVAYDIKSAVLLKRGAGNCAASTPAQKMLQAHLGVQDWLLRTASTLNSNPIATIDKPSFNTDITVKFGGSGSYTYSFAHGTDFASLGGSYAVDEQLNISMTPAEETKKITFVSLPSGQNFASPGTKTTRTITTISTQDAKQRLDTMQLEQAIRSLQSTQ